MSYSFENVTILIAEDNQPMLELLQSLLSIYGFKNVIVATDGQGAFELYCQHKPDLVITDWMMKPVDGIELINKIRTNPKSPNQFTPVILMTGFGDAKRVASARDAGVTEFLVKPFNARDLYRRLAQIIEKPRDFVRSEDFFGPDRRRKTKAEYSGPRRRERES